MKQTWAEVELKRNFAS